MLVLAVKIHQELADLAQPPTVAGER